MKDIAEQEVIDIADMDVEAFNDFAAEQGWSDGMPLYVPTEEKVAKFVEKRGEKLGYTIAFADNRETYDAYMKAAG